MKVAIIGAGLIGKERIKAIQEINKLDNSIELSCVYDISNIVRNNIKDTYNVNIVSSVNDVFNDKLDWVFIATPNNIIKDIIQIAFKNNVNVLVEKPLGRNYKECNEIISLKPDNLKLNVGFNYRFFNGIESLIKDTKNGKFGDIISVNMILGHGNSPNMKTSWKLNPKLRGNVTTDLGVHLFDVILQLSSSEVFVKYGTYWNGFWNTGIEEESHFILLNKEGTIFNCQVSFNRWRSSFKLEVNGTEGYGIVENRGGNYGPQSYRTGKRWGWLNAKNQASSEELIINNYNCEDSFIKEIISVLSIKNNNYQNLFDACDHINAQNIMKLLNDYELILSK